MKMKNRILAIILVLSMSILTAFVPSYSVSAAYNNSSRVYYEYDNYGNYVSSYTLSSLSTISSSSSDASVNTVIGDDERYYDNTKNGVVRISNSIGNYGSGFVVDEHTIATAAHCVYSRDNATDSGLSTNGAYVTYIRFYDENGSLEMQLTTSSVEEIHVPKLYASSGSSSYDYALITVEEDLSDYMCFNLGIMMDEFIDTNTYLYVTGFPSDLDSYKKSTGYGNIVSYTDYRIWYDTDTNGGASGGPIYIESTFQGTTYYTVVAIHTTSGTTSNAGVRITPTLLHFYYNNSNI